MEDENKDANTNQSVADSTVSQVGTGEDVSQNSTDEGVSQVAADNSVPYGRFKEVNEAKKLAEERIAELEAEKESLANQMAVASANRQDRPEQKDLVQQVTERLGLQDEQYLNKEQSNQVLTNVLQIVTAKAQSQAFIDSHPDFSEVVGSYDIKGNFVPAAPMRRVLSKIPNTARIILNNPGAEKAIYELVKNDAQYKTVQDGDISPEKKAAADAAATIEAANRQASISAASGGGTLDKRSRIGQMTDEEFDAHWERIKSGAI